MTAPGRAVRRWRALGLVALLLIAVDVVLAHTVHPRWALGAKYLAPYATPVFNRPAAREVDRMRGLVEDGLGDGLHTRFDAELGWRLAPEALGIDPDGARGGGESVAEASRLAMAFGCSFTFGDEVEGSQTWCEEVQRRRPGLRVRNFGVGGYGLDQALLRLEREVPRARPDEVWLALMPMAAPRAATHFRGLDQAWSRLVWPKPRMALGAGGELERFGLGCASPAEALALLVEPGRFREAWGQDPFLRLHGAALAEPGSRALHHSFTGRVFLTWRLFEAHPPERALNDGSLDLVGLHAAIARRARDVAEASGARLRYLILPSGPGLELAEAAGERPWNELAEVLAEVGIEVWDGTDAVRSVPELERWQPAGHYSPRTNAAVGAALAGRLAE